MVLLLELQACRGSVSQRQNLLCLNFLIITTRKEKDNMPTQYLYMFMTHSYRSGTCNANLMKQGGSIQCLYALFHRTWLDVSSLFWFSIPKIQQSLGILKSVLSGGLLEEMEITTKILSPSKGFFSHLSSWSCVYISSILYPVYKIKNMCCREKKMRNVFPESGVGAI